MERPQLMCTAFKPLKKGAGFSDFADIEIPALKLIIRSVALHERGDAG